MYEKYEEIYAGYDYAKRLENGSYNELKQRLQEYNKLIIERSAQHEHAANKRLRSSWLIVTLISCVLFLILFSPKDMLGFLALLLISSLIGAFLVFVFFSGIHDWIYLKNLQEAHELETLKFRWLVVEKELEKRDSKEAEQILIELEDELIEEDD